MFPRLEEVEHGTAAAIARSRLTGRPGQDDRLLWFPPGAVAGIDAHPDLAAAQWVVGEDLDRPLEHRRDPERVDRAHRLHPMRAVDPDTVTARARRKRIGDEDRCSCRIPMSEVLTGERRERLLGVEVEAGRCGGDRLGRGYASGREAAQDPLVEQSFAAGQPPRALTSPSFARDRSRGERHSRVGRAEASAHRASASWSPWLKPARFVSPTMRATTWWRRLRNKVVGSPCRPSRAAILPLGSKMLGWRQPKRR